MKKITVWFDMDGTIADLYGHENWLKRLRDEDATIFEELKPMCDMSEFLDDIYALLNANDAYVEIGIITWTPMEAPYKFQNECAIAKTNWIEAYLPEIDEFHAIPYGTPKQSVINTKQGYHILVDDNEEVRKTWDTKVRRKSVDAKALYNSDQDNYGHDLAIEIVHLVEKMLENIK